MKISTLLLLLFLGNGLLAQQFDEDRMLSQLVPGYVVLQNGDTLKGKVKVQTRSKNEVKVKFYNLEEEKREIYKPKQILGYGYQTTVSTAEGQVIYSWRHFITKKADMRPKTFASKMVFMEVIKSGKAILYSYYVEFNEKVALTYKHYYYLEFESGMFKLVTEDNFGWTVPEFLEDCQKIATIVGTRMGYSNLEEMVEIYNSCDELYINKG